MIDFFLQYIQYEKNYSSHTVLSYSNDLKEFSLFVESYDGKFDPALVDSKIIRQWVVTLMENGLSPSSVNRKISSLKSFYRFLLQRKVLDENPTKKIKALKTDKKIPFFFKESEINAVLQNQEQKDDFETCRNKLIIAMFYETGIRLSELIEIKDADIDTSEKTIIVIGKRRKQRIIPFGEYLLADILSYIQIRDKEFKTPHFFYVRKNGEKMYPKLVYQIVTASMSVYSSLTKRSPHVLRHTFATSLLNGGAEINAVKELLGHASLAATQVYTHTTFEQLRNIYKQAHPRA